MTDYTKLSDEDLLALLFTEEDRLPRAAVDEFVRRGDEMVDTLSDIVSEQYWWTKEPPEWWAVVHAVYILGAIGGKESVLPLLRANRWAVAYDCDWVTEELPSIFGKIGLVAIDELKKFAKDMTSDWYTRSIAIQGLAAITIYNADTENDIFKFIHAILADDDEDREVRQTAGNVLIDFLKSEYKDDLLAFGREEQRLKDEDFDYIHAFSDDDVEEWFSKGKKDFWFYTKDWLSFYDEDEIKKRQKRWEKEEQERLEKERLIASGENPYVREEPKTGRNDLCPCGSGKKYKKCCMSREALH